MSIFHKPTTIEAPSYKFRRLIFTLGLIYAFALNTPGNQSKLNAQLRTLRHNIPSENYRRMIGTMESDPSLALANATDILISEQNLRNLEESLERVANYTSSSHAVNDQLALTLASITAFDNLLHSDEFINFRIANNIEDMRQFKNAILQATLALDFDRTINDIEIVFNTEDEKYEIVSVKSGGPQQISINELQIRLVAGRWAYHMHNVLTKYNDNPEIVANGELTDTGVMLALVEFANWSNIFRVISEVDVFKEADITNSVVNLMNTEVYEQDLTTSMIMKLANEQLSNPDVPFEMFDYNTFYPGSHIYDYFLQVHNGVLKPHKSILALKLHPAGNIDAYIMNRSLETIMSDLETQSNQSNYYLNDDTYAARLSDFQRSFYYNKKNEGEHDSRPMIEQEA